MAPVGRALGEGSHGQKPGRAWSHFHSICSGFICKHWKQSHSWTLGGHGVARFSQEVPLVGDPQPVTPLFLASQRAPSESYGYMEALWRPKLRCGLRSFLEEVVAVAQSLSCVQLFATPWTAACQAPLFFPIPRSLLILMSIKSVMPSNHLILCCPLLLLL